MTFRSYDQPLVAVMKSISQQTNIAEMFDHLTRSRRSIRGFLERPVRQSLLEKIFETAAQAPSNCNSQPWQLHVVSGEKRDRLAAIFSETIGCGNFSKDFPYDGKYEGVYRQRQLDVGILLYQALGVAREDSEGKKQAFLRNIEFFGAPHAVFVLMPDWCGIREAADVGMYAQNLMLAMQSHGLASCPQTILGYDANSVRAELGIEPEMKLLFGISFGYENPDLPENQIVPDKACLSEFVHFHDQEVI